MSSIDAIRAQLQPIPLPTRSFAGQTIVVTGSNTGLGLEAARHFVRLNATRVILAVRSIKKGEDAKASIEASTDRQNVVEVWQIDMSNYNSIKAFAVRCNSLDRLDVVVANAGVLRNTYEASEGTEITIKVNVIGTALLAFNLFPMLRRSKMRTGETARLVITSSVVHENAKFRERHESLIFEAFKKDKKSYIADRYNTSKLLEVLLVRSISEAMQKGPHAAEPLILNNVNPGLCHSELDKDLKVLLHLMIVLTYPLVGRNADIIGQLQGVAGYILTAAKALIARTTEVGSRTLVHSAASGDESHGQYMSECKVKEPSAFVRSEEGAKVQERVHKELMDISSSLVLCSYRRVGKGLSWAPFSYRLTVVDSRLYQSFIKVNDSRRLTCVDLCLISWSVCT